MDERSLNSENIGQQYQVDNECEKRESIGIGNDPMGGKVDYNSSEHKRFEISQDRYSRERIRNLKEMFTELKKDLNIDLGMILFGSLSKGKALNHKTHNLSDIDVTIYINQGQFKKKCFSFIKEKKLTQEFKEELILAKNNSFSVSQAQKSLQNKTKPNSYDSENLKKLKFIAAKKIIDKFIFNKFEKLFPDIEFNAYRDVDIQLIDDSSIKDSINQLIGSVDTADYEGNVFQLARYFALDVGGGMKKYRQNFLNSIAKYAKTERDRIWTMVSDAVVSFERKNNIPISIRSQYPKTYEQACKYYGVNPDFGK